MKSGNPSVKWVSPDRPSSPDRPCPQTDLPRQTEVGVPRQTSGCPQTELPRQTAPNKDRPPPIRERPLSWLSLHPVMRQASARAWRGAERPQTMDRESDRGTFFSWPNNGAPRFFQAEVRGSLTTKYSKHTKIRNTDGRFSRGHGGCSSSSGSRTSACPGRRFPN